MKHRNTGTAPVPCPEWAEKLAAWHLDDLSISERIALETHVTSCPACTAVRNEYHEMDARILGLSPVAPLAEIPVKLWQVMEEQDAGEQAVKADVSGDNGDEGKVSTSPTFRIFQITPERSKTRMQRLVNVASAIAAVLVVGTILGGFLLLFNGHRTLVGGPIPANAGPVVFLTSEDNDGTVYAVRPSDGALYWQYSIGHKLTGALAVSKDTIFTGSYDGSVYALRKSDGSLLWQKAVRGGVLPPMLTDGKAIYFSAASGIYALRTSDGSLLWHDPMRQCDNCPEAVVAVADGTVYAYSDGLYALRTSDGKMLWHDPTLQFATRSFEIISGKVYVPVERGGVVYVLRASDGSHMHTFTVQKGEPIGMVAADGMLYIDSAGHDLYGVRTNDDRVLWHKQFSDLMWGLSGVSDGTLYFAESVSTTAPGQSQNSDLVTSTDVFALRGRDGSQLWHWHDATVAGISSQLLVLEGRVYFTTGAGGLYALRASDGAELWHVLQGKSLTDPVAG